MVITEMSWAGTTEDCKQGQSRDEGEDALANDGDVYGEGVVIRNDMFRLICCHD